MIDQQQEVGQNEETIVRLKKDPAVKQRGRLRTVSPARNHCPTIDDLIQEVSKLAAPKKLRGLAAWYRRFAERAENPVIWEARLQTAEELEAEADRIEAKARAQIRSENECARSKNGRAIAPEVDPMITGRPD